MNKSLIGASAALSILVAAFVPAAAHAQSDAASVPVSAARSTYTLGVNEFDQYANAYKLGNGQVARFKQDGLHYWVQLKNSVPSMQRDDSLGRAGASTRLRPVGPHTFVTDSGAEVTFREDGEEVSIANFERLPAAKVAASAVNVQMVARR